MVALHVVQRGRDAPGSLQPGQQERKSRKQHRQRQRKQLHGVRQQPGGSECTRPQPLRPRADEQRFGPRPFRLRGGLPAKTLFMGDHHAPQGTSQRVRLHGNKTGQHGKLSRQRPQRSKAGGKKPFRIGEQQRQHKQTRTCQQRGKQQHSCLTEGQKGAAQIVPELVTGESGKGIAAQPLRGLHPRQKPWKQLPVSTRPAVEPLKPARPRGGSPVVQAEGAVHGTAGQFALQQIVTQHRVRENPALRGDQQPLGVINALALIAAPTAEPLIQGTGGAVIRVCAAGAVHQQLDACADGFRVGAHQRLKDAHALPAGGRLTAGSQGMA